MPSAVLSKILQSNIRTHDVIIIRNLDNNKRKYGAWRRKKRGCRVQNDGWQRDEDTRELRIPKNVTEDYPNKQL
jgi:hypothetical protein